MNTVPQFSNSWFDNTARPAFDAILPDLKPQYILELGSFEGRSASYFIRETPIPDNGGPVFLHCVDTWQGSQEHHTDGVDMTLVEKRFVENVKFALEGAKLQKKQIMVESHKTTTAQALMYFRFVHDIAPFLFDLIFVDGSHRASDTLEDMIGAFHVLRSGGYMVVDDYLWVQTDPSDYPFGSPQPGMHAFLNVYADKIELTGAGAALLIRKK